MTVVAQENREVPEGSANLSRAHAHAHLAAVDSAPGEVLPKVPSFPRVRTWAARTQVSAAALLEKPGTLLHAQPPTFRQAHARHRECAGHYGHPAVRRPRAAYGYGHMIAIKAPLNYIEWATDSPLRGAIHVLLGLAVWLGLLLGGYL